MKKFILALIVLVLLPGGSGAFFGISDIPIGDAVDVFKGGKKLASGYEDFTPEQEYYIGRAVAAIILGKYTPYDDPALEGYINVLGQAVAQGSDVPQIYGGYHFQVLDSDEINAFATPGGHVFVTRGLLSCCSSEGDVAAVLAHEIGHIQNRHGIEAIKDSRVNSALTSLAAVGARAATPGEVRELTDHFEDSLADITETMLNSGYSRAAEREADETAVVILRRVGYDPNCLVDVLGVMDTKLASGGPGFGKTHPDPKDRIKDIGKTVGTYSKPVSPDVRAKRFQTASAQF